MGCAVPGAMATPGTGLPVRPKRAGVITQGKHYSQLMEMLQKPQFDSIGLLLNSQIMRSS